MVKKLYSSLHRMMLTAVAWMALSDYDGDEGTLVYAAPRGDDYASYVRALLAVVVDGAPSLGYASLLAHWRAGWSSAEAVLEEHGFAMTAPGMWRRRL